MTVSSTTPADQPLTGPAADAAILFSTVIPTFNRRHMVVEAVESALAQNRPDQEIIVVDDGSTDDTLQVLESYAGRIRVERQENAGPGAARNRGIAAARGRYVTFLDSDDLWYPWTLATFAAAVEKYQQPALIAARHGPADLGAQDAAAGQCCEAAAHADYLTAAAADPDLWVLIGGVAIRTDFLRAVGGFHPQRMNAEDSDLWLRLGDRPGFIRIAAPPVLCYRRHADSATSSAAGTYVGLCHMVDRERRQEYPGGRARRAERLRVITAHARAASLHLLQRGCRREAWSLYRQTFAWNLGQGRLRYLAGFPLTAARRLR